MKRYCKYIAALALIVTIIGCIKIVNLIHPDSAPVNTEMEVKFDVEVAVDPGWDIRKTVILGILVPSSWEIAENAVITYSSADMPGGAVTNMPMRLTTGEDLYTGKTWPVAMTDGLGFKGNYEPMEWVAFISVNEHEWKPGDNFTTTMNIKMTVGAENVRTNLTYFVGNKIDGIHNDPQYYALAEKLFETTGGDNALIDYTVPKICYITPEAFTWEDIVAIHFDGNVTVDNKESLLKDAEAIYVYARATYNNDTEFVEVSEISEKTLMTKNDANKWALYFYPHSYFNIPADVEIDNIYFSFSNSDKSIVVRFPGKDEDFLIPENCE